MTRAVLLLSCLFAAACSVGEVGTSNNTGTGTDAGTKTDGGGTGTGNGCKTRLAPPGASHPHTAPVNAANPTNAGENCVAGGCHLAGNVGTDAPAYQFGGTVYKTGGTVPSVGAAIVLAGGGSTATVYSDTAGNFAVPDGSLPNPFVGTVSVSGCPTISMMASQISAPQAGCGGVACHIGANATGGKIILADQ
jgi:hypothetical protein